jgi:Resolvase, N terminal domain
VTERRSLARAIAALGPGDTLIVTRLDRLARSTRDLLNTLDAIAKAGAGFRSIADAWADTTTAHGRLMLTVLGGLAEFERELIRARTDEGRKRAKVRGVRFGRKPKLTVHQRQEAIARKAAGEALVDIGRVLQCQPLNDFAALEAVRRAAHRDDGKENPGGPNPTRHPFLPFRAEAILNYRHHNFQSARAPDRFARFWQD